MHRFRKRSSTVKFSKVAAVAAAGTVMAIGAAVPAFASSGAGGAAIGSPGLLSGNVLQHPVHHSVNFCGDTFDGAGLLNSSFGNACINADH